MSSSLASLTVLIFFGLALVPLALAWRKPRTAPVIGLFYAAGIIALFAYWNRSTVDIPPDLLTASRASAGRDVASQDACPKALEASEQTRLILDRGNPARVEVRGVLWDKLPPEMQAALTECLQGSLTDGTTQVEIIKR